MSQPQCIYCEKEVVGTFCHHCGQKQGVHRIEWRYLFEDLQKRFFGFDNNFLRTLRDLTVSPGTVIGSTLKGIRVKYVGPVGYFFLMVTLFALIISIFDINLWEASSQIASGISEPKNAGQEALQRQMGEGIYSNFRLFSFVMMPFFILALWLIFKNKKYNLLETSVVMFYAQGHTMLISLIAILVYHFGDVKFVYVYASPISYFYISFVCASFYQGNAVWNFVKGLIAIVLGFVFLIFLGMVVAFFYLILNPEVLEQFQQQAV
jgi:hypothetical protein